jgi:hypothetical protein
LNNFELAIHILRGELWCQTPGNEDWDEINKEKTKLNMEPEKYQARILSAVQFLEVANKVDKKSAEEVILWTSEEHCGRMFNSELGALVGALPDKEEK